MNMTISSEVDKPGDNGLHCRRPVLKSQESSITLVVAQRIVEDKIACNTGR